MSLNITDRLAVGKVARIAGGLYVAYILASVLADVLGHIGLGTPQQVAQAIVTNPFSFRLGLVVAFVSAFLFLATAWGLYVLLRPVNKDLALLFLLLNAVGVAIHCASMFPLLSAMLQGGAATGMEAFSAAQLEGHRRAGAFAGRIVSIRTGREESCCTRHWVAPMIFCRQSALTGGMSPRRCASPTRP